VTVTDLVAEARGRGLAGRCENLREHGVKNGHADSASPDAGDICARARANTHRAELHTLGSSQITAVCTCVFFVQVAKPSVQEGVVGEMDTVNFEASRETLQTMLDGLGTRAHLKFTFVYGTAGWLPG
jgi:hypothetical protein